MMKPLSQAVHAAAALSLLALLHVDHAAAKPAREPDKITISVRSSPSANFESTLDLESGTFTEALRKAKSEKSDTPLPFKDIYVTVRQKESERSYRMESPGSLWNEAEKERLILTGKEELKLLRYAEALRRNHYGEVKPWEEARSLVPRKSTFAVTDLESGLTFNVQRRAGSGHADVQPLTKDDTKIMKQIYNNRWSWKRKAILVRSDSGWLAASMNGMPHGGDGIPGNGFSGHFCIHFYGSTTHRSGKVELAHQLMVMKAAGKLRPYLDSFGPDQLTSSFAEAIEQQDPELLRTIAEGCDPKELAFFVRELNNIDSMRFAVPKVRKPADQSDWANALSAEISMQLKYRENGRKTKSSAYTLVFARESHQSPWRIREIRRAGEKRRSSGSGTDASDAIPRA